MKKHFYTPEKAAGKKTEAERPDPRLSLRVSSDYMTAYLRVEVPEGGSVPTPETVAAYLADQKITTGLLRVDIESFCRRGDFTRELLCAVGTPPAHGVDGELSFHFSLTREVKPMEREDGTIDYHSTNLIQVVGQGDLLCSRTMPVVGTDGMNIYGYVVPCRSGREVHFPDGENTVISEDGLSLLAAVTGSVEYLGKRVHVKEVFIVKGDVCHTTGDIRFPGTVIVYGDVREDFSVAAGGDVEIRGRAGGAHINAGGNIRLANGINGMGKGSLEAGANITGCFFENIRIACAGDLRGEAMLNCQVSAGGSILLSGQRAVLVGGEYEANERIYAKNIGNASYVSTIVVLCRHEADEEPNGERVPLLQKQALLSDEIEKLESRREELRISAVNVELIESITMTVAHKKRELAELAEVLRQSESVAMGVHHAVIASRQAFPGVRLTIGTYTMPLDREYDSVKFFVDQGGIIAGQVLPSDH